MKYTSENMCDTHTSQIHKHKHKHKHTVSSYAYAVGDGGQRSPHCNRSRRQTNHHSDGKLHRWTVYWPCPVHTHRRRWFGSSRYKNKSDGAYCTPDVDCRADFWGIHFYFLFFIRQAVDGSAQLLRWTFWEKCAISLCVLKSRLTFKDVWNTACRDWAAVADGIAAGRTHVHWYAICSLEHS